MSEKNKKEGLNIELPEEISEGSYSNLAIINHSPSEFVLDFIQMMPGVPKARVKSRIILTDNSEVTIPVLNFTKKVGLLFGVSYQKMRYSKFIIKPISSILIALVRRLKMYNNR